jgi:hypothetical protein
VNDHLIDLAFWAAVAFFVICLVGGILGDRYKVDP